MTDGLDQALANAGLDLLRADTELTIYGEKVPDGAAPPYVRVYTWIEWPVDGDGNALDGRSNAAVVRWYCHCIGADDVAARAVEQRVRTNLLDQSPSVAGMSCGMIRHEQSVPPDPDETTGALEVDAVNVFRLSAWRST